MLDALRNWILNISTAIFFITAVELILPNNSTKKYAKFILGLILITVVINPLIKVYDKNFNINSYVNSATKYFEEKKFKDDYEKYKKSSIEKTAEVFSSNLGEMTGAKLEEKFKKYKFKVTIDSVYQEEKGKYEISGIKVGVNEGSIKKIEKIKVGDSKEVSSKDTLSKELEGTIVEFISKELNIDKQKIMVYKM